MAKLLLTYAAALVWVGCSIRGITGSFDVQNPAQQESDYSNEIEERIIGGTRAEDGQFPFAAALYFQGTYACTASIISRNIILTAAHCVVIDGKLQKASEFYATVGSANRSSLQAQQVGFSDATIHPKFNSTTLDYDVAYLTLIEPLSYSRNIQKICLSMEDTPLYGSILHATTLGWGQNNRYATDKPDVLRYAQVKLLPHVTCQARYLLQVTNRQICGDGFGKTVCKGDSGGPLIHPDGDATVQIGVASFINSALGCGSFIIAPGVYMRISAVVNWITESTNDKEICTL